MKRSSILIVGTGTGVGKTHLACALLLAGRARGWDCLGLKPIESGVQPGADTDADALRQAGGPPLSDPPYRFPDPVSPHLAARRVGERIELARVVTWVALHQNRLLLVETAGGLLTPLGASLSNLDLAVALQPDTVLVVSVDRLGVLHDVGAVLLALRSVELRATAIALNAAESDDPSSGTNSEELQAIHGLPLHVLPRSPRGASDTLEAASRLLDRLV